MYNEFLIHSYIFATVLSAQSVQSTTHTHTRIRLTRTEFPDRGLQEYNWSREFQTVVFSMPDSGIFLYPHFSPFYSFFYSFSLPPPILRFSTLVAHLSFLFFHDFISLLPLCLFLYFSLSFHLFCLFFYSLLSLPINLCWPSSASINERLVHFRNRLWHRFAHSCETGEETRQAGTKGGLAEMLVTPMVLAGSGGRRFS